MKYSVFNWKIKNFNEKIYPFYFIRIIIFFNNRNTPALMSIIFDGWGTMAPSGSAAWLYSWHWRKQWYPILVLAWSSKRCEDSFLLNGFLPLKVYNDLTKPAKFKIELHRKGGVYGLINISAGRPPN